MSVGILGYGNLGASIYNILRERGEEVILFSNRAEGREGEIVKARLLWEASPPLEVLFLAHGSTGGYRDEILTLARSYHLISAYDIHSDLSPLQEELSLLAKKHRTVTVLGSGWDPGVLSLARVMCKAILPEMTPKTAWGEGVSEGHSFALRQINGVRDAIQYTVPSIDSHRRVCYVVCDTGEESRIRNEILNKKEYFSPSMTEIHFVSDEEFQRNHKGKCFHRGRVSTVLEDESASIRVEVEMQRNPDFTARIMVAYLSATRRLIQEGRWGCYSPLEIPLSYLLDDGANFLW